MSMVSRVVPCAASPNAAAPIVYALHSSRELPMFDPLKAVNHVILPSYLQESFCRFLHCVRGWISLSYAVGFTCGALVLFVRPTQGTSLAALALLSQLPTFVTSFLVLRFDIMVLIGTTFEFWYITIVNVVCAILMSLKFNDSRFLMVLSAALSCEFAFLVDAVSRAAAVTVVASVMGALADAVYVIVSTLGMMDGTRHVKLFADEHTHFSADSVVYNLLGTISVLLLRNAYRKHQLLTNQSKETMHRVGTCIMYRCRLELRRVDDVTTFTQHSEADNQRLTRLVYAGSSEVFDVQQTIMPQWITRLSVAPCSHALQRVLWLVGGVGLLLHVALSTTKTMDRSTSLASLVATSVFCGTYWAHSQRQLLLRELLTSFDYVFMSFQFTMAHLCICDVIGWNANCLVLVTSWLWSHWVITLDAVTPVMKRKLGYCPLGPAVVVLTLLLNQSLLVSDILGSKSSISASSSALLKIRETENHVASFLFWRLVTSILWCLRLLWRLQDRRGDELLVLQGQIQYEDRRGPTKRGSHQVDVTPAPATDAVAK